MASNAMHNRHDVQQGPANTPHRRVLGDVSPNIKALSTAPAFLKKPPASSPLKRSYTASIEGSDGLRYLKKRKLSDEEALSQVDGVSESVTRDEMRQPQAVAAGFRPVFQPTQIQGVSGRFVFLLHPSNPKVVPATGTRNCRTLSNRTKYTIRRWRLFARFIRGAQIILILD